MTALGLEGVAPGPIEGPFDPERVIPVRGFVFLRGVCDMVKNPGHPLRLKSVKIVLGDKLDSTISELADILQQAGGGKYPENLLTKLRNFQHLASDERKWVPRVNMLRPKRHCHTLENG